MARDEDVPTLSDIGKFIRRLSFDIFPYSVRERELMLDWMRLGKVGERRKGTARRVNLQ